jgi:hypothetical protein
LVDTDAILPSSIAKKCFESICWRNAKLIYHLNRIQLIKFGAAIGHNFWGQTARADLVLRPLKISSDPVSAKDWIILAL